MRITATLVATTALLLAPLAGSAGAVDTSISTTPVTDGPVNAVAYDSQGRAYVGGEFQFVGPRLGSGLAFSSSSNAPTPAVPDVAGSVLAAVPDGAGGEFIGGSFTSVGGIPRARLAHIHADGTLDANWNPGAKSTVRALALSPTGDAVFVGGDFSGTDAIGGKTRSRLAKLSAVTGAVDDAWDPAASSGVLSLAVSATTVYVGGNFGDIDGVSGPRLAKVSASGTGAVDSGWAPNPVGPGIVRDIVLTGTDLYVGGIFSAIGGQTRSNLAKLGSGGTGAADATWNPSPDGPVNALQLDGANLFVGGDFFSFGAGPGSFAGLAKVPTAGAGTPDASWHPDPGPSVDALALSGGNLVVGGWFSEIDGQPRNSLASVLTTGAGDATPWEPRPNGEVLTLAASGPSRVFAGGDFSSAGPGNQFRGGLIRLNPNGSLDEGFDPLVQNGGVFAISVEGSELFIGGQFGKVYGQNRVGLAKMSTAGSGSLDAGWVVDATGPVYALARSGSSIFVGGDFVGPASIGGVDRNRLAKVSTTAPGTVDATWDPNAQGKVKTLAVSGTDLFAGGDFFDVGGQPRDALAKLLTTGTGAADATWDPSPGSTVDTLLVSGSSVFAGGLLNGRLEKYPAGGTGAPPDAAWNPNANNKVSALALSGTDLYAGGSFGTIGGLPRHRLARLSTEGSGPVDPAFEPAASNNSGFVLAIAATPSRVLVGGTFNTIGPLSTSTLAVFDLTSPTVALTSPFEGARFRVGQDVTAAYTCDDPDGAADSISCTGTRPNGSSIDTASAGAKSFTATATDAGGKSATSTVHYTVDGSAPDISIAVPADGSVLPLGTKIPVAFSCTDADGAGDVGSCVGSAPNGSQLDTSKAGTHTFTVTAADLAGNTSTKTVSYSVPAAPAVAPVLSALRIKPAKFRKAPRGKPKVSFRLSTRARVTFTITRKGKRVGRFARSGKKGANKFTFRGRSKGTKGKRLKPGRYRMSARAKGPTGLVSRAVGKPFRVVR